LLYALGLACILVEVLASGFVHRQAGSSAGSVAVADLFDLLFGGAGALFVFRAWNVSHKDAKGTVRTPSKNRKLYVIGGAILAVVLFVVILFLTGSH
jgi:hypothetical protein